MIAKSAQIRKNIIQVQNRIRAACERSGRKFDEIKIVAVSKTVSADVALQAFGAGVTDIGENRAQDMLAKHRLIGGRVRWHFIGHLQRNKVKQIIEFVELIHSLDNLPLAAEIDRRAGEINKIQKVLVEVNISGEISKYGLRPAEVFGFIKQVADFDNLEIAGLMTMAPLGAAEEEARSVFRGLKKLSDDLGLSGIDVKLLSMGMTDDFEIAVEEGADLVRIGRAIFEGSLR